MSERERKREIKRKRKPGRNERKTESDKSERIPHSKLKNLLCDSRARKPCMMAPKDKAPAS